MKVTTRKVIMEKTVIETDLGIIEVRLIQATENGEPIKLDASKVKFLELTDGSE